MNIQNEIEKIKTEYMDEIVKSLDELGLTTFNKHQAEIQHKINSIQLLVGPENAPKILSAYATMLTKLNKLAEDFKKEVEK